MSARSLRIGGRGAQGPTMRRIVRGPATPPSVRKPIEKRYGEKAEYSETAYERRRREARERRDA